MSIYRRDKTPVVSNNKFLVDTEPRFYQKFTASRPYASKYCDWIYDNIAIIDDKLYFAYTECSHHFASLVEGESYIVIGVMDADENISYKIPTCDNEIIGGTQGIIRHMEYINGILYMYGNQNVRFKSYDKGTTFEKETITNFTDGYGGQYMIRTSTGRLICGCDSSSLKNIYYSDDNGKTWVTRQNVIPSGNCSHPCFIEIDDVILMYTKRQLGTNMNSNSIRILSKSYDYGETWSEPIDCTGDFRNGGTTNYSMRILEYGGIFYAFVGFRGTALEPTVGNAGVYGRLQMFRGTKEDVINGTMTFVKDIDTMYAMNLNGAFNSDSGNIGAFIFNGKMYIVWACVYGDDNYPKTSNQEMRMYTFRLDKDTDNDHFDADWKETKIAGYTEDTTYDKYYYGETNQNIFDNQTTYNGGGFPVFDEFIIPVGNRDFEFETVFKLVGFMNYRDPSDNTGYIQSFLGFWRNNDRKRFGAHQRGTNSYTCVVNAQNNYGGLMELFCQYQNKVNHMIIKRVANILSMDINGYHFENVVDPIVFPETLVFDDPDVSQDAIIYQAPLRSTYYPASKDTGKNGNILKMMRLRFL